MRTSHVSGRPAAEARGRYCRTVAVFRYAAEPVLPAGGILLRRQAQPGRELSTRAEHGRVRHNRGKGRGRYGTDARNRGTQLAIGFSL